jgi:hypothetical protein
MRTKAFKSFAYEHIEWASELVDSDDIVINYQSRTRVAQTPSHSGRLLLQDIWFLRMGGTKRESGSRGYFRQSIAVSCWFLVAY